jgi:hypothetical protein
MSTYYLRPYDVHVSNYIFPLSSAGNFVQLQPTTRGSFPRTPCITVFAAANGSEVVINDCSAATQQRGWNVVAGGSTTGAGTATNIQIFNSFCLEVTGGVNHSGTKVEINSCVPGNPNQQWQWNSNGTVQWAGTNKCLDLTNGDLSNGNQVSFFFIIIDALFLTLICLRLEVANLDLLSWK